MHRKARHTVSTSSEMIPTSMAWRTGLRVGGSRRGGSGGILKVTWDGGGVGRGTWEGATLENKVSILVALFCRYCIEIMEPSVECKSHWR